MLDDTTILAALRGDITLGAADAAGFAAARDAFLTRIAAPRDHHHQADVTGTIEILRDRAGVPHIFATTTPDLYFGLGVAMAEDRLWQMDRLRRRAFGRQAEILGPSYVAADIAHLTVGLDQIADREVALIDQATSAIVESFVAGINHAIAAMGEALPIEFRVLAYTPEPFTVRDVVGIARAIWWSLNGRIDRLIAAEVSRLLPEPLRAAFLTPEASENLVLPAPGTANPPIPAGTDDATGSNNWALAGSRTESGLPVLAGDPHQPFWVPSSWYEFALHGPEDHAAGSGQPGLPGLWWGSNGTAAWCLTNNMASTRDLYREELDPADPSRYRDGDRFVPFTKRTVVIKVCSEADRPVTIRSTVRGPIVNALVPAIDPAGDPPMSLRWVGAEHLDDLRAIIGLARARTWPEFRAVLQDWSVAVFNWIYADATGHIGYQMAGRIPIRGRTWPGVRDAGNPDDRWQGMIPFDGLPTRHDPPTGALASANQRIVGPAFPYPIYGAYSQGHRGVRLDQVFNATPILDTSATIALQNDVKNTRAERNVRHILSALATSQDTAAQECIRLLTGWDFRYTLDSAAPTLFETFMARWNRAVQSLHIPAHLIDLAVQQTGLCVAVLDGTVPDCFPEGLAARIEAVARDSIAILSDRLGEDRAHWTWGHVHIAHWRHPLSNTANAAAFDIGPAPVDGGSHTLRNTGGELPPHRAASGAEYRIVVDFAAPEHFLAVQNIGNSGVPGSPFYRDQFQPWLDGRYHTIHLTRVGVEADLVAKTIIEPRKQGLLF